VGISKAKDRSELVDAMDLAVSFADRVLVERAVPNLREINCAVLGDGEEARASACGKARAPASEAGATPHSPTRRCTRQGQARRTPRWWHGTQGLNEKTSNRIAVRRLFVQRSSGRCDRVCLPDVISPSSRS
jgi:hypothetical protein